MGKKQEFKVQQVVFLEYQNIRLYTEIIQVVESRQICWVRPLMLADFTTEPPKITDMGETSDLFWSMSLFQPALDTEVITLLSQVWAKKDKSETSSNAKEQLHDFLRLLCHEKA